jgi:hypothetical protein
VDPLGVEHTWRLTAGFVKREVAEVKRLDPGRPILLNGFLPMSAPVAAQQWWRTRDQGDSLALAEEAAEIVGVDFYPCHALGAIGGMTAYMDAREPARGKARGSEWPAAHDQRGTGRTVGGGDHSPQPSSTGDGELSTGARDRELQPVRRAGSRVGRRAGGLPLLGRGVLALATAGRGRKLPRGY